MKHYDRRFAIALFTLFICVCFGACSGEKSDLRRESPASVSPTASLPSSPADSAPTQRITPATQTQEIAKLPVASDTVTEIPKKEQKNAEYAPRTPAQLEREWPRRAAPMIDAIPFEDAQFVIVYRHTHHGYLSEHGYDTEVVRFYLDGNGAIEKARRTYLLGHAEKPAGVYLFRRTGNTVEIIEDDKDARFLVCYDTFEKSIVETKKKNGLLLQYSLDTPECVTIREADQTVVARWCFSDMPHLIRATTWGRKWGAFSVAENGWRYTEDFVSDRDHAETMYVDAYQSESGILLRANAVEAIMEGAIVGEPPSGLKALELWALVNYLLGYDSGLDPYIARLALGV